MPHRKKLPSKRVNSTYKVKICGESLFMSVGKYANGKDGEIFLDMSKQGSTMRGLLNGLAISISLGLQYGVPIERYIQQFEDTKFPPAGVVDYPEIGEITSILDCVAKLFKLDNCGVLQSE